MMCLRFAKRNKKSYEKERRHAMMKKNTHPHAHTHGTGTRHRHRHRHTKPECQLVLSWSFSNEYCARCLVVKHPGDDVAIKRNEKEAFSDCCHVAQSVNEKHRGFGFTKQTNGTYPKMVFGMYALMMI